MDVDTYQELALRTCSPLGLEDMLIMSAFGLSGETGEVADVLQFNLGKETLGGEAGDCLWYVAVLAHSVGLTMNNVLYTEIDEFPDDFSAANMSRIVARLHEIIKKHRFHKQNPNFVSDVKLCLALYIIPLIATANQAGFTMQDLMESNIAKLEKRHGSSFRATYTSDSGQSL